MEYKEIRRGMNGGWIECGRCRENGRWKL